jgi:hypothetical protein
MEKIIWTEHLRNEEVLCRIEKDRNILHTIDREGQKYPAYNRSRTEISCIQQIEKDRNILHTINRKKPNWIGHMLRRNCRLKHATEER